MSDETVTVTKREWEAMKGVERDARRVVSAQHPGARLVFVEMLAEALT